MRMKKNVTSADENAARGREKDADYAERKRRPREPAQARSQRRLLHLLQ
jgi:hypothetical protein